MVGDSHTACLIPLLSRDAARAAGDEIGVPPPMSELNVFRLLLQRPRTAKAINDLLLSLLFHGDLDPRLRELIIMRLGWATGSNYEWTQHWRIALDRHWCSEEDLLAVRDWRQSERFDDRDCAVLSAVDDSLATGRVSRETWSRLEAALPEANARLEVVAAIGTWRMISQLARSLEIPLEEGIGSWPPEGVAPEHAD